MKQLLLWNHRTHRQKQGTKNFSETKPLLLINVRQSQETQIPVKQLLLWSHITHLQSREQKNFSEIELLLLINARQSQGTKIAMKQLLLRSHGTNTTAKLNKLNKRKSKRGHTAA